MSIKKILLIFAFSFSCIFTASNLTSCYDTSEETNIQEVVLTNVEKQVYNAVKNSLTKFKNPSSVTVISVGEEEYIGRYIKISAQNGFGGYSTAIYLVLGSSINSTENVSSFTVDYTVDVSKINLKLQEYKKSQGWI